jgi:hypothetical protein
MARRVATPTLPANDRRRGKIGGFPRGSPGARSRSNLMGLKIRLEPSLRVD